MKKLLNKVEVHPLTYIVLLISFFASFFEYMFLLLFIIFIHELGHLIMASFLGFNISKITLFPFGGLTTYDSNINESILKELLICISGPLIQVFLFVLIINLNAFILESTYDKFVLINKYLLLFNLLPISPLDGGRFLNLICNYFISYKKSLLFVLSFSLMLDIVFMFYFLFIKNDILIFILFLLTLKNIISEILDIKNKYNKFLLERYLFEYNYKDGKYINKISDLRRNKKHKIIRDNFIYDEKSYLKKYVFNI